MVGRRLCVDAGSSSLVLWSAGFAVHGGEMGGVLEAAVFTRASECRLVVAEVVFSSPVAECGGLRREVEVCAGESSAEGISE